MTKEQALSQLIKTNTLSTDLLKPLGISFNNWLVFAQLSDIKAKKIVSNLITFLQK